MGLPRRAKLPKTWANNLMLRLDDKEMADYMDEERVVGANLR